MAPEPLLAQPPVQPQVPEWPPLPLESSLPVPPLELELVSVSVLHPSEPVLPLELPQVPARRPQVPVPPLQVQVQASRPQEQAWPSALPLHSASVPHPVLLPLPLRALHRLALRARLLVAPWGRSLAYSSPALGWCPALPHGVPHQTQPLPPASKCSCETNASRNSRYIKVVDQGRPKNEVVCTA